MPQERWREVTVAWERKLSNEQVPNTLKIKIGGCSIGHGFDFRHSCPHFPKGCVDRCDKPRPNESVGVAGRKPSAKLILSLVLCTAGHNIMSFCIMLMWKKMLVSVIQNSWAFFFFFISLQKNVLIFMYMHK